MSDAHPILCGHKFWGELKWYLFGPKVVLLVTFFERNA